MFGGSLFGLGTAEDFFGLADAEGHVVRSAEEPLFVLVVRLLGRNCEFRAFGAYIYHLSST